jgi:hypothetical protein
MSAKDLWEFHQHPEHLRSVTLDKGGVLHAPATLDLNKHVVAENTRRCCENAVGRTI